jgi:DNA/RNA-binding domain of Phe-tRNA-synthetase-like protein
MRFQIEDSFFQLYPEAHIGVIAVRGIDNALPTWDTIVTALNEAAQKAASTLTEDELAQHPAIAPWREAYRAFGVKPAKFRSSIENLLRSARAGGVPPFGGVRSINPLVDIYNTISLQYLLPCGGEDVRAMQGNLRLTRAEGGEHFVPLGSTEEQAPQSGEVIYRDDVGVICRCLNWREAERTKLTPMTTDSVLFIETIIPDQHERLSQACEALLSNIQHHLGGKGTTSILHAAQSSVDLID